MSRLRVSAALTLALAMCVPLAVSSTAQAAFGIVPGSFSATAQDNLGNTVTQAGAHPNATTSFELNTAPDRYGFVSPVEDLKDVSVDLPVGVVGNPTAAPQCRMEDFATNGSPRCPTASQVGVARVSWTSIIVAPPPPAVPAPIFNLVPNGGEPARFGFRLGRNNVVIDTAVRTGSDYGITATVRNTPGGVIVFASAVTLWGVPADPAHDADRFLPGFDVPGDNPGGGGNPIPASVPPRAFFTNPTSCEKAPVTNIAVTSWQHPDTSVTDQAVSDVPTGCDRLIFDPSLVFDPSVAAVGQPSGYRVKLTFRQNENPIGLSPAALRTAVVRLPAGVVVSPSSADGLQSCSPEQIALGDTSAPTCPPGSKLGTVSVKTPLLSEPLTGSIYLAAQTPQQLLKIYLVAQGSGVTVKLAGPIEADPVTGQLTSTFTDNPQLPVSEIELAFKHGPRAPLANPRSCGNATTTTTLLPWSSQPAATPSAAFDVSGDGYGAPCPGPRFAPQLVAGTTNPTAGGYSPLTVRVTRTDADEYVSGVSVSMPEGLLARIAGTTLCDDAAANAGSCGEASHIGSVTTGAGPGTSPLELPGRVYLTGPYKGGPFGLAIVVPAVAGPFDLGTVVVRAGISIDPIPAAVRVVSDPLPTIRQWIPLQIRMADVKIDRAGFTLNPTSCAPKAVEGALTSVAGTTAAPSARFQASDCASLALKPKLALMLSGKGQTTDGKHPAVTATLTQPVGGQANLKKVRVALPLSLALDPDNANGLCEFAAGSKAEPTCPKNSIVGTATARTPILDEPLTGPVYFVKNERKDPKSGRSIKTTPKLVIPLVGQNGVKLTLTGTSTVDNDQLVTTFDNIPDAPVSSFKLNIIGGKGGILVVSGADICKATQIADQQIDGQNTKAVDTDVFIQTPSCPVKVISKKVTAKTVVLKVGGLGSGKVTVTGRGIRKTTKTITRSTVTRMTVKRTKSRLGKVKVSFVPKGAKKAKTATATLR